MKQQSLASQTGFEKCGRKSRRELFLNEMEQVVPWPALEALVQPHYPKAGNGHCMSHRRCGGLWAWTLVSRRRG